MPNILVVDDSPTIRKIIITALLSLNPVFNEAATGLEAIEKLTLRPHDVITLDINMPDMHGIEFLRFVRSQGSLKHIPVIVITTRTDQDTLDASLKAGANAFLLKPFSPDELLTAVKQLLDGQSPK